MKPSWKIARIVGVDIYVHATFPLLLGWVALSQYALRSEWVDVGAGLVFIVLLFLVVILHEFGHILAARRYGIRTRDITLLPIGGLARLDRLPVKTGEELIVALAGPAVNVAVALILFLGTGLSGAAAPLGPSAVAGTGFLTRFAWANVWLAGFNLLPALPLDGGRVLRALLGMKFGRVRATRIAATTGRGVALAIGMTGLLFNPFLVVIALFIWFGAAAEADATELQAGLSGVRVSDIMLCDCHTLTPEQTLASAANQLLATTQEDYPVLDRERHFLGLLRQADLIGGISDLGPEGLVGDVMQRRSITSYPSETVDHLLQRWPAGQSTVAVIRQQIFLGLFTPANLGEYLLIHKAVRNHANSAPHVPVNP
jgi:Zn-dependent protease